MRLAIILILLIISDAYATDCEQHPILCQIIKNSPNIDKDYALKISNIVHKMHKKYNIPVDIFVAILKQESNYSLEAKSKTCGLSKSMEKKCVYTDFGISQIHYKTVELWGFDIEKLNYDLEYSIEAGAKILADFMKRYKHKEKNWYVRYNCGERGPTDRVTCQQYKRLIERYF